MIMIKEKIRSGSKLALIVLISIGLLSGCNFQLFLEDINREINAQLTTETSTEYGGNGEYQPRDYDFVGSAEKLDGKILVVTIFLSDLESSWTPENELQVKERVETAGDFIEESAAFYGTEVEIISDEGYNSDLSYECYYNGYVYDFDSLGENFLDPFQETLLDEISADIPTQQLLSKYDAEGIAYVGVANKDGRSYAYPYDEAYGQDYFNECCCLFFTDETYSGVEPPAVYAHEILHLFGAQDLYEGSDETYNEFSSGQYDFIARNYSNEIMYTTYDTRGYSVDNWVSNELTEITAYYLGWIDTLPSGFVDAAAY